MDDAVRSLARAVYIGGDWQAVLPLLDRLAEIGDPRRDRLHAIIGEASRDTAMICCLPARFWELLHTPFGKLFWSELWTEGPEALLDLFSKAHRKYAPLGGLTAAASPP